MSLVDLDDLRARVRADRRTVAAPLLAFGLLTIGNVAATTLAALAGSAALTHSTALFYWPVATAVALLALWWYSRRLTVHKGVGPGDRPIRTIATGYLVALPVLVVLFVPLLFIGVFAPLV